MVNNLSLRGAKRRINSVIASPEGAKQSHKIASSPTAPRNDRWSFARNDVVVLLYLILFVSFPACSRLGGNSPKQVCFADQCIDVEVAKTKEERARGLQGRESLGNNEGMLFILPKVAYQGFWMKETLIPLDIVWIGADKRIVSIMSDIKPCTTDQCPVYTPNKMAMYVLEVNAGVTAELGLSVGDQARF